MNTYRLKDAQIELEASQWLARLGDTESGHEGSGNAGLLTWLQQSPQHVRAFLDASDAFYRLDGVTPRLGFDPRTLLAAGISVTALPGSGGAARPSRKWALPAAMAAAVALAIGITLTLRNADDPRMYATAIGEQRTVKLDDGSFVQLNARSRMSIRFSDTLRQITLLDGEALFTVERDPGRPFIVRTGTTTVRALGTAFNVYRHGAKVQVAVVNGSVQVTEMPQTDPARQALPVQPLILTAGQEAHVILGRLAKAENANVTDAIAWRQRRLVFKDTPLMEVADEFNRYNKSQLLIVSEDLKAKPLTGIFSADHPQSLILYLSEFSTLTVVAENGNWVVRERP